MATQFGVPEHWAVHEDDVVLKYEVGLVTGTELTVSNGKIWFNQQTVSGNVGTIRQIASLLHEADAIAALQRIYKQ